MFSCQICCLYFFYLVFLVAVRAVKTALFFELYRLSYEVHAFKMCYKENIHAIYTEMLHDNCKIYQNAVYTPVPSTHTRTRRMSYSNKMSKFLGSMFLKYGSHEQSSTTDGRSAPFISYASGLAQALM